MDRGIDASRCVGPAALGTGRVCGGGGGAARGTRAGRRAWLEKDSLQNEKGLDRYIDQILTEKAEKRE